MQFWSLKRIIFALFALLFVVLLVFVEKSNGKFWTNDLKVYFGAVNAFVAGENPYGTYFGLETGFFKYPPTVLLFMWPMSFFSFETVQILHSIVLYIALLISVFSLEFLLTSIFNKKIKAWFYYASFGFIAIHIVRELHLGNLNLVLLAAVLSFMVLYTKKKAFWALFALGLGIIIKPILILVVIPLLVYQQLKMILALALVGIVFVLISLPFGGVDLWMDWFTSIGEHGDYIISENSLSYLAAYYIGIHSNWWPSLLVLTVFLAAMCYDYYLSKQSSKERLISWGFIFLAFTPNFFVTDTEHFILSLPMVVLLLFKLLHTRNYVLGVPFVLCVFGFSLNSNDLLKSYSNYLDEWGVLGLGNLVMIILLIALLLTEKRPQVSSTSAIQ